MRIVALEVTGCQVTIAGALVGSYDEQCVVLYEETIPLLVSMAIDSDRFRDLWAAEDAELTAAESALAEEP